MAKPKTVRKVEKADRRASRKAIKAHAETPPLQWLGAVSGWADQPPVAAICALTTAAGLLHGDARLTRTGLRMGAAFALTTLSKALVKSAVDRTRPREAARRGYKSGKGRRNAGPVNSFPSGHTGNAVALAGAIAREYPQAAAPAYAVAAGTGALQLPRGAHYGTDVVAGAVIGAAAEAITARLFVP
jgi:membrane-associated phospholipid phosphatase